MGANWSKSGASRIIAGQPLNWTGSGVIASTNFGPQTYQIRVISQIPGWISVDATTTVASTTTFAGLTFIAANTAAGDTLQVTPGQVLVFTSTSTTTGTSPVFSLTELA